MGSKSRSTKLYAGFTKGPKYFVANGVAKQINESIKEIIENFASRILFEPGYSDVPATEVVNMYSVNPRKLITSVRRYDWDSYVKWLNEELNFQVVAQSVLLTDDFLGNGLVLLAKK